MEEKDLKATLHYYCREKYYHAMQAVALEGLRKFPGDQTFSLYNGLSLVLGRRIQEGIRELDPLQNDRDVVLGAVFALVHAHRRCMTVDKEALSLLDLRLKEERKNAGETALYHAACVLFHTGKPDKAREYVDKLLKVNSKYPEGLVIKGWIEMSSGKEGKAKDASQYFDIAIDLSPGKRNMDATFGKARYRELQKDYEGAVTLLNKLVVHFPSFAPPLVEKMKNQLALLDVDLATETANRILSGDPHSPQALQVKALALVCREGNYEESALGIRRLYSELERSEPKNAELFYENAQLFSRTCGRNAGVLAETFRLAEKAAQLDPNCADFMTELGYQCFLQGRLKDAVKFYRNATKIDDASIFALSGLTMCQLAEEKGATDQARQQVEFLREVQGSQPSPDLLLMSARLASNDEEKAAGYLNEAVDTHFRSLRTLPYGSRYLRTLDPDFLLQVVKEFLVYSLHQPTALKQSLVVLEAVSKACPGLVEGQLQLARVQLASEDSKAAAATLQHVLADLDATCADAHLLTARIYVDQGDHHRAAQSLEVGLSYNFQVRERPLFHLLSGLVQRRQGKVGESITSFQTAVRTGQDLPVADRATLLLDLAEAYKAAERLQDAAAVIQDATEEFHGTPEQGRVTIASADLSLVRGDINGALRLLAEVGPGHAHYQQARTKMADIHLHHRKDRRAFAECFRELVENTPDARSFALLGDAYLSIEEPDRAIEAFEQALKRCPRDPNLARSMGKALVRTHQYGKAINHYRQATGLGTDLAELFLRLGQFDKAEKTLEPELKANDAVSDPEARTQLLLLLARVREKSGNIPAAMATLREAKDCQGKVLGRAAVDQSEEVTKGQRRLAADICRLMAEHASTMRDQDSAIKFYKESLAFSKEDPNTLVALARLYMQVNDLEQCQLSCMALLQADSDNEAATVMLADLAFRKVDLETASFHFQQLLSRRPDYWTALARLVEVMRRSGSLDDIPGYLSKAEVACPRANQEAGLSYCKGLYEWYRGNPNGALSHFNAARRDPEWGRQAVHNMIEICLNPDDDPPGGETADDDEEFRGSREMALRTAERLLRELQPKTGGPADEALNYRLLGNFLLLATRLKVNVEQALKDLTTIASQEAHRDHVGTALGLATGYMMLKQVPRARNQLKRVAKNTWNLEDAEYLERCWLLLTDIYVQNGKYDLAGELLKRVLQHNKACTRAYEYAGFISEKEQSYREASIQYEQAWQFGGKCNPAIGYKLAFNYMKGKRFADAINVCQQVLKVQPDYPRIRKEILDKSRNNLRT